jgi:hypothetical protein
MRVYKPTRTGRPSPVFPGAAFLLAIVISRFVGIVAHHRVEKEVGKELNNISRVFFRQLRDRWTKDRDLSFM